MSTLLLSGDEARDDLRRIAREVLQETIAEQGDPLTRALDAVESQFGVLTVARVADMLGVAPRTVTENYVKEKGLRAHRTGPTSSPWFLLDEVCDWVKGLSDADAADVGHAVDDEGRVGDGGRVVRLSQRMVRDATDGQPRLKLVFVRTDEDASAGEPPDEEPSEKSQ